MALPPPGSSVFSPGAPSGARAPREPMGMDYTGKFRIGPANFRPGRGLSVSEIYNQRENRPNAMYADGRPVPAGMPIHVAGWNTSGVGPGSRGYRGSGGTMGYSFENQGTAASKRPDYSTHFGGLNEFYRNQQSMGDWDRLQGEAAMDQQDAEASKLAQLSRIAAQRGDYETAAQFADALNERAAMSLAAQSSGPWAGITSYGNIGGAPTYLPGSQAEISRFRPVGMLPEMPQSQMSPMDVSNALGAQAALDNRYDMTSLGESAFATPYGTISSAPTAGGSSFINAQGSIGPGSVFTNYGGRQTGPEFFSQAADRQRTANRFAQPAPGYNGRNADDLDAYAQRLLSAKQRLGKT